MRNNRIKEMTYYAMFIALIAVLSFTPLGMIPLSPTVSVTDIHIVVVLAALLMGLKGGIVTGLAFGVLSWLRAITAPVGVVDPVFTNVLVSIFPRLVFGVITGVLAEITRRKFFGKTRVYETVSIAITAAIGTLIHTSITVIMMYLIGRTMPIYEEFFANNTFSAFFLGILGFNGMLELAAAIIITPILFYALRRMFRDFLPKSVEK